MAPTKADLHACLLETPGCARLVALMAMKPSERTLSALMVRATQAVDDMPVKDLPLLVAALASLVPKHKFHEVKKTERAAALKRNTLMTELHNQFQKETDGQ